MRKRMTDLAKETSATPPAPKPSPPPESLRPPKGAPAPTPLSGCRRGRPRRVEVPGSSSGAGKFGLASLRNLDQLPVTGAVVIAALLKIVNGSGSPLRVLALVE